ncbi:D-xylose ABC transporter, periplasmic substrate-binding protein [Clostridium sp. DL-VIII]|uniref:D-xylose ABC transporter substrate-binding protein n=1 Tax=Clostridium sp. DL-VIII TaxID=641107 RepID=UPI00023B077B|nr:D-xylose ABC transporter substrate-binding protein [Clostridium sp. DL-VIII]EHJ01618.1 D-xylose ABC transporter, periplasmic substrate-binding protein [Clostridium sp. DL-VIII]
MKSKKMIKLLGLALSGVLIFSALTGCGAKNSTQTAASGGDKKIKIGVSFDDLRLERWQHDKDIFEEEAKKLGAEVVFQSANGDDPTQMSQCENLISQGVNVLVIIPHNGETIAPIVDEAHQNKIKVLAYDRLITNSDLDDYISFDNVKVGELQGKAITDKTPKGNYFMMGGSPTDNNAKLFRQGQMNIIKPLVDKGDIKIVGDQWAKDWLAEEAMNIMENALTANNNKIDAVVASNDSTAGGAIQALQGQGLAGKVSISGQDADLAACQRVVEGTQTMTVYKPIKDLATQAADLAVKMGKGENVETNGNVINNGQKDVPSVLLTPIAVTADNMNDTVVKDGFQKFEDVYKNVPEDKRPSK